MERNVEIGLLFSIYRNMLTERQAESVDLYYNEDLSLSEISEHMRITRQGVRDNIKRAENTMFDVEKKLGLAKRFRAAEEQARQLLSMMETAHVDGEIKAAARELMETVKG